MNTSKSLRDILQDYGISGNSGDWFFEDVDGLVTAIVEAVEGLAPKPKDHTEEGINVAEENWRLGYDQAVQDFLQAIKEWQ